MFEKVFQAEIRDLRRDKADLEEQVKRMKVTIGILEEQLAKCHESLKRYESVPPPEVFDHTVAKAVPIYPQVVFASTDGQD